MSAVDVGPEEYLKESGPRGPVCETVSADDGG